MLLNGQFRPVEASDEIADVIRRVRPSVTEVHAGGRGIGTGIVWGRNAVLTNAHVVGSSARRRFSTQGALKIVTHDRRVVDARVARSSPQLDLAVLEADTSDLPQARLGDSAQLRVGQIVFALGNPWGEPGVATSGIVSGLSAVDRDSDDGAGRRKIPYIRSDVQLAPGNSGGPLLNARAEVVGINAMILGGDLSVAIPSQTAADWFDGQAEDRARLGIGVQAVRLPETISRHLPGRQSSGLLVVDVQPDGAASAGLMVGDVLIGAGGRRVADPDALAGALAHAPRDGRLSLAVVRGGELTTVEVQI